MHTNSKFFKTTTNLILCSIWALAKGDGCHLGAVAGSVDRYGFGQVGCRVLQSLPGVGCHQLTQLTCLAEGQRTQPMLYTLSLHSRQRIMLCTNSRPSWMATAGIQDATGSCNAVPHMASCAASTQLHPEWSHQHVLHSHVVCNGTQLAEGRQAAKTESLG